MFNNTPFVFSFALLLSFPLLFLFAPRFFPPKHVQISLPDELDDLALFRRATLATLHINTDNHHSRLGTTTKSSSLPKPKIAFLFLTNSDLQFAPLWELFFANHSTLYNIYIHADPSVKISPPGGVFQGHFISSKKTQRGSPTLISAARRLLATALLDDPLNSYFAVISQHCIPLHSFDFMYNSLFTKPVTESTRPNSVSTQSLIYRSFIEILSDEPQLWGRYNARGENVMLPEVPFHRFRVGSQFFILNREHALLVIKDRRLWRKFRLPCLNIHSCYPEEHYFPTLLSMEDPEGSTHYTLTRVNWTGSTGGHPHTYQSVEVSPELIRKLRVSNSTYSFMFARKFSPDCLKTLLHLAEKVIFRD
ncbi:hypothetical protein ACH5RR_016518 [Cinchona calisaya]|uniref:Uncharacterized protein n=1 Tax=Cinchona calisaya TaxID=153742 RepID=A0ABD2ZX69_9GENT